MPGSPRRLVRIVTHPTSLLHATGAGHPESAARIRAITAALREAESTQPLEWCEPPPATADQLLRVHPREHLNRLHRVAERGGGLIDADTVMSPDTWDAAVYAAGGAIAAAFSALDGVPAFAAVRPPGHHATATRAMGFCFLNNVVIAARAALAERDVDRVLIVDWDVHHGNGTQDLVERDAAIRYVSLHQSPLYPGTGRAHERGAGNVFNVPRPPGLGREEYRDALNDAVAAATDGWNPDLILISAGFDALAGDPLAGFTLEPEDYAAWRRRWRQIGAPIASVLEGGYVPDRIAAAAVAHVNALGEP